MLERLGEGHRLGWLVLGREDHDGNAGGQRRAGAG